MKTLKLTDKQLEQLSMCFYIGYNETLEVDDDNLHSGFIKEKDMKRKHKIMNNVLRKITKASRK